MRAAHAGDTGVRCAWITVITQVLAVVRYMIPITIRAHSAGWKDIAKTTRATATDFTFIGNSIHVAVTANEWGRDIYGRSTAAWFVEIDRDAQTRNARWGSLTGTAHAGDEVSK